jgi:RNA polymerase sigma factor (sigma-70 family)
VTSLDSADDLLPPPNELDAAGFLRKLSTNDPQCLQWLNTRVRMRAARRFSSWAWTWIEEDFASDLLTQLVVTTAKPDFKTTGSAAAYVDVAISNLCTTYFRRVARMRSTTSLDHDSVELPESRADTLAQIASVLEVRRVLEISSSGCRRLLAAKYLLGKSLREIALEVAAEEGTVRRRLHACREFLRSRRHRESLGRKTGNTISLGDSTTHDGDRSGGTGDDPRNRSAAEDNST